MTDPTRLADRYLAVLNGELGWNATANERNDVLIPTAQGYLIVIANHAPRDPEYLEMYSGFGLTGFGEGAGTSLDLNDPGLRVRILAIAGRLTRQLKGVKVTVDLDRDFVIFSAEAVTAGQDRMPAVEHLAAILPRMRSMLRTGIGDFHEEMVLLGLESSAAEPTRRPD